MPPCSAALSLSIAKAMVIASMALTGFANVLSAPLSNVRHPMAACEHNKRALLIGIAAYKYWAPLPHVEDEIRNVSNSLTEHGYCVYPNLDIKEANTLTSTIRKFFNYGGASDTLLFFYSGHGDSRPRSAEGKPWKEKRYYLVPKYGPKGQGDVPGQSSFLDAIVDARVIADAVAESQSKNIMVVLNTCHSGKFHLNNLLLGSICPITTENSKRILITSGNDSQLVAADTRFSEAFLKSIDTMEPDSAGNNDGTVTLNEMVNYMGRKVEAHPTQDYVPSSTVYPSCREQPSLPIPEFFSHSSSSSRALLKLFKNRFATLGFSGERRRLLDVVR